MLSGRGTNKQLFIQTVYSVKPEESQKVSDMFPSTNTSGDVVQMAKRDGMTIIIYTC